MGRGGGGWGDALFFRHDAFLTILGHYRYMYSLTGQILKQLFPSVLVPSDCHLGFFKNFIFNKNAANFLEISRKHVFTASNMNLIKNINYKWRHHPINVKRYVHYRTTGTESFILIASTFQFLGQRNLWGAHLTPLDIRGLK